MLGMAQSWEDCVWAYYKTIVDLTTEEVLQRSPQIKRPWQHIDDIALPDEYYMQRRDLNDVKEIFEKIACNSDQVCAVVYYYIFFYRMWNNQVWYFFFYESAQTALF